MDEVSVVIPTNLSGGDWFPGATEEDAVLSLPLDASEGGLFAGNFVPPPPRPLFLDESVTPDGLTTCDLCSWAWQNGQTYPIDATLEAPGELGWVLTLVIVSLTSAVIGAIVMIVVLHCRKLKNMQNESDASSLSTQPASRPTPGRPPISTPDDKSISTITQSSYHPSSTSQNAINGVWSWLSRRSPTTPSQLDNLPSSPVENHYTHMEDAYNSVGEALYAELDRESTGADSNSPAYQNSAYTDPDAPVSSAPSSAYYSDLSVTTVPDRAYEVVGLVTMPVWESNANERRQPPIRLAAISENVTVPSDYV